MIIKGKVPVSHIKQGPFLKKLHEPNTGIRTYELCYEKREASTSPYAETLVLVVYEEPEVPDFVRLIRIRLPGDRDFEIESQAHRP